jgi:hypothetical protein
MPFLAIAIRAIEKGQSHFTNGYFQTMKQER